MIRKYLRLGGHDWGDEMGELWTKCIWSLYKSEHGAPIEDDNGAPMEGDYGVLKYVSTEFPETVRTELQGW